MKHFSRLAIALLIISSWGLARQTTWNFAEKAKRFAPTIITADTGKLSPGDRKALRKLIEASRYIDSIYLRQVWSGNVSTLERLRADHTPEGKARLNYFLLNMGPWSKLDNDEPFVAGVPEKKPAGANYYPEGVGKDALERWINALSPEQRAKATGYFWVVRIFSDDERLYLKAYNDEYGDLLKPAAALLHEAAGLTTNASLKTFLNKRADAFLSNDYYDSDVAWMELDSPIEPTIGPYEVYMDELFNYKAAFESYITLRNEKETAKLAKFSAALQEIEDHLPIDPKYRNPKLGASMPIRVVDEVAIGGEARAGVQTAAYNLPNDEKVVSEKGSKKILLKNVQEAKFNKVLLPIARVAVDKSLLPNIEFEPFFTHILAHELMHGLGPQVITVNGRETTVRQEMKEIGSALEEAKADISGLFALRYLMDKGSLPDMSEKKLYSTYLASIFRSVRFGLNDSHGKGTALQFNYLSDEGAFPYDPASGTFSVDFTKIKGAVSKLTGEIMTIQAEGSYTRAKALLDKYGLVRPGMQQVFSKLTAVPVDIAPEFPLAK